MVWKENAELLNGWIVKLLYCSIVELKKIFTGASMSAAVLVTHDGCLNHDEKDLKDYS